MLLMILQHESHYTITCFMQYFYLLCSTFNVGFVLVMQYFCFGVLVLLQKADNTCVHLQLVVLHSVDETCVLLHEADNA